MEDFLLQDPTPQDLRILNQCRLYLRVASWSDICTAHGHDITQQCWEGTHPMNSTQLWPNQEKPRPHLGRRGGNI